MCKKNLHDFALIVSLAKYTPGTEYIMATESSGRGDTERCVCFFTWCFIPGTQHFTFLTRKSGRRALFLIAISQFVALCSPGSTQTLPIAALYNVVIFQA